jgi:hypothetical protein
MIFAITSRFNRYVLAALPFFTLMAAGCGSETGTGAGGAGGAGATGGSGGTGATGGATGGSGGTGGSAGTSGSGGGDAGSGTGIYGAFTISILDEPPPAYTKLLGLIYDGPQIDTPVLKLDRREGDCELLVPKNSFCMGGCPLGVCVDENVCQPLPATVSVGIAHVSGFKGGEFPITPLDRSNSYQPSPTLPERACDEGGTIQIRTDKFTLQGTCVAPLEVAAKVTDKIPVKTGMPVRVQWTPPTQMGASRFTIKLDISHHGGLKGVIKCDVPDTGSFEVPLALSDKLISLGLAGFPTADLKRVFTAVAPNEPNVKILVTSDVTRDLDTGVISCMDSSNCPPGQMCDRDLTCK